MSKEELIKLGFTPKEIAGFNVNKINTLIHEASKLIELGFTKDHLLYFVPDDFYKGSDIFPYQSMKQWLVAGYNSLNFISIMTVDEINAGPQADSIKAYIEWGRCVVTFKTTSKQEVKLEAMMVLSDCAKMLEQKMSDESRVIINEINHITEQVRQGFHDELRAYLGSDAECLNSPVRQCIKKLYDSIVAPHWWSGANLSAENNSLRDFAFKWLINTVEDQGYSDEALKNLMLSTIDKFSVGPFGCSNQQRNILLSIELNCESEMFNIFYI